MEKAEGFVWHAEISPEQYENLKTEVPIISTIPSGGGWEVQFVGEKPAGISANRVEPNLEHAYVHYMDNKLEHWNLK